MWRNPIIWLFIFILGVLTLAIWATIASYPKSNNQNISAVSTSIPTKLPSEVKVFASDPSIGTATAQVTIIEFGDFECAYCASTALTIKKVFNENPSKIRFIWKDFPLPAHEQSTGAAEAGQCAARQGKFWQYHDALFANQGNLNESTYLNLASSAGLNYERFSQCLKNHETLPLVQNNFAEGQAIGVDGTPYFIINGQPFSGILTEEQLKSFLN